MLAATTAAAANDRHWHAVTATTTHSPSDLFTMSTLSLPDRKSTAWTARLAATQPSCDSHGSAASKDLPRLRKPMLRSGAIVPTPRECTECPQPLTPRTPRQRPQQPWCARACRHPPPYHVRPGIGQVAIRAIANRHGLTAIGRAIGKCDRTGDLRRILRHLMRDRLV